MDINKLKRKFINKGVNAGKENIPFNLTFEEFKKLAEEANITDKDMHIKGHHLSRHNDNGAYEVGNCRFIFYLDNYKEKKISEKSRKSSRENIKKYNKSETKKQREKRIKNVTSSLIKLWDSVTEEEKRKYVRPLEEKEIKKRHVLLKAVERGKGYLTRASKVLKIEPQSVGRFLRKYPLK